MTPQTSIRRALSGLGLEYGTDFKVHQYKRAGKIVAIRAAALNMAAEEKIAENREQVVKATIETGNEFCVVVERTRSGQPTTYVYYQWK